MPETRTPAPIDGPVRIFFVDVDGTLTDGVIGQTAAGELRHFFVRDGLALPLDYYFDPLGQLRPYHLQYGLWGTRVVALRADCVVAAVDVQHLSGRRREEIGEQRDARARHG